MPAPASTLDKHRTKAEKHGEEDISVSTPATAKHPGDTYSPWEPVDDWTTLKGLDIEIHIGGRLIDQGRVDDVMADGSILWLMHEGATGRRIIENARGTCVRQSSIFDTDS
jgi:hypothetical protein